MASMASFCSRLFNLHDYCPRKDWVVKLCSRPAISVPSTCDYRCIYLDRFSQFYTKCELSLDDCVKRPKLFSTGCWLLYLHFTRNTSIKTLTGLLGTCVYKTVPYTVWKTKNYKQWRQLYFSCCYRGVYYQYGKTLTGYRGHEFKPTYWILRRHHMPPRVSFKRKHAH